MKKTHTIAYLLVIVLVGGASGYAGSLLAASAPRTESITPASLEVTTKLPREGVSEQVQVLKDSVVSIAETQELKYMVGGQDPFGSGMFGSPFLFFPFGQQQPGQGQTQQPEVKTEKRQTGAGTGFVISSDGMLLTNKHVVENDTAQYSVIMSDGRKFEAKVLARDPVDDLALVQVQAPAGTVFTPVSFIGDAVEAEVGDFVLAIGNALGQFDNSVSFGVISAMNRSITAQDGQGSSEALRKLIQTDAAINPGNSGGPLVGMDNKVLGITTAVAGGAQGIGFAIPLDAKKIESLKAQYKEFGKLTHPYIGLRHAVITPELNKENKLGSDSGAWVHADGDLPAVLPNSPAAKAGLKGGDVITKVDGIALTEDKQLVDIVAEKRIGDEITLTYIRDGKEETAKVTLEALPDQK